MLSGVDFSDASERAVQRAVDLAKQLGNVELHLAHVWSIPVYALPDGAVIFGPETIIKLTTAIQTQLDALMSRHEGHGVPLVGHVVEGSPAPELVRLGNEIYADLLVVGTHGRRGLSHLLLGSVAEHVVRSSSIPVLTVPPERSKKT